MAGAPYLTAFALIAALIVVGVLAGVGLVLVSWLRERYRPLSEVTPAVTRWDRAA
jgi:hypothetical protein